MSDLNNKRDNTYSNKLKKISGVCDFICRKIDEDQSIKRMLHYQTESPLSKKSVNLSGAIINQPDITTSLEDINVFNEMFYEKTAEDLRNYIFVYSPHARFKNITGTMRINIDILVPVKYNKLKYKEEKRINQISNFIADMFDEYIIENDFIVETVGNLGMEMIGYKQFRLSKTNDYKVLSVEIDIDMATLRGDKK